MQCINNEIRKKTHFVLSGLTSQLDFPGCSFAILKDKFLFFRGDMEIKILTSFKATGFDDNV